jgi:hypothetical protein
VSTLSWLYSHLRGAPVPRLLRGFAVCLAPEDSSLCRDVEPPPVGEGLHRLLVASSVDDLLGLLPPPTSDDPPHLLVSVLALAGGWEGALRDVLWSSLCPILAPGTLVLAAASGGAPLLLPEPFCPPTTGMHPTFLRPAEHATSPWVKVICCPRL